MAANINDKLRRAYNTANPETTFVTTTRAASATTLICDNLTGWPTDTAVDFVTYQLEADGETVKPGTQTDWKGIVSGNTITNLTRVTGAADTGNSVNDIVEAMPTAKWADDLIAALLVSHNQDGSVKMPSTQKSSPASTDKMLIDDGASKSVQIKDIPKGFEDNSIPASKLSNSWWEEIGRTSTVLTGTGGNNNMEITLSKPCKYVKIIASGKLSGGSIYSWLRFNDISTSTYDRSWMQTAASTGALSGASSQGTVATMGDADWDYYVESEASAYRSGVVVYNGRMGSLRRHSTFGGYVSGGAALMINKVRIGFDNTNVTQAELIILGHN